MLHFFPSWHELKYSVPAEIRIFRTPCGVPILYGQRVQFRLAAPMQWINLEFRLIVSKKSSPLSPTLAALTCVLDVRGRPMRCS